MEAANLPQYFKKNDQTDKENYRLFSLMPKLSKVLERCIYNKCHVLLSTNKNMLVNKVTGNIQNKNFEKLLGNKIDSKVNIKDHIGNIRKKATPKSLDQSLSLHES